MTPQELKSLAAHLRKLEYKDVDYLNSPSGWLGAKLGNRLREGFEIWYDPKRMSWRGLDMRAGEEKE